MEQQAVDGIEMLGHFLDHHDMAGEIGDQFGPDQHGQCRQVECSGGTLVQMRLEAALPALEPVKRALNRLLATLAPDIARQRPMRHAPDAMPVERTKQEAGVRIAEIGLRPSRPVHRGNRLRSDAIRPVSAHRKPHRIEAGIVGAIEQRREPHIVAPGEMPVLQKALLMEM